MVAWYRSADRAAHHVLLRMSTCAKYAKTHTTTFLACIQWPALPWQRIHVDFKGPLMGTTFLVVVDGCSKWPEVFSMASTTAAQTLFVLNELFWCTRTASEWQRSPVYIWGVPDLPKEQWNQACDLSTLSPSYKWLSWKICAKLEECTVGHDTW